MKRALITALSLFLCVSQYGQDLILKRNGEQIEAIILSVAKDEVQYREYHDSRGRVRRINKPEIHKIVYSSGTEWIINPLVTHKEDTVKLQKNREKYSSALKPAEAMFYSVVLSGGGQFYNKQTVKGGILMGFGLATLAGGIISNKLDGDPGITVLCFLHYAAVKIYSIIDAPVSAVRINQMYELSNGFHFENGKVNITLEPVFYLNQKVNPAKENFSPVYGVKLSIPIH